MPLSVIGAGLGRTGTLSLKLALEQLGFGPSYHMVEVFKDPEAPAAWSAVADGAEADWEAIFRGYAATVDWPGARYWRELSAAYPQAKVILTLRDPETWFASTQATIFKRPYEDTPGEFHQMLGKVIGRLLDHRLNDKARVLELYRTHNEAVQREIPPERLLVYNVAEGWGPLCRFLGVAVPGAPFPQVNGRNEVERHVAQVVRGAIPS